MLEGAPLKSTILRSWRECGITRARVTRARVTREALDAWRDSSVVTGFGSYPWEHAIAFPAELGQHPLTSLAPTTTLRRNCHGSYHVIPAQARRERGRPP